MRSLSLTLLLVLVGCASPADAPSPSPSPADDGGGAGGGSDACVDRSADGACRFEGEGSGCGGAEVCTLAVSRSCGAARCCTLGFSCEAPAGVTPGGFGCTDDGDCESGLCLTVAGEGICLRACEERGLEGSSCPPGLACALLSIDATRSVRSCVGLTADGAFDAAGRLCRHDGECGSEHYCRIERGTNMYDGRAYGLCVVGARTEPGRSIACEAGAPLDYPPGTDERLMPARGTGWSEACAESGLCHNGCYGNNADVCLCRVGTADDEFCRSARCTRPCRRDDDCPSPLRCLPADTEEFTEVEPDLDFRLCLMPSYRDTDWGCWDEADCCVGGRQRSGRLCCEQKDDVCALPPDEVTHCRVTLEGARFSSRCARPEGLAGLGAPCDRPEACESGLCGPDARCTSPCDRGPGDRCASLIEGTSCCPMPVGDACVPACRSDCASGPSCTP